MLGTTLESVKQRFGRMGLEVSWHGTGQVLLPSDVLDAFLLALAECLENVRRHSGVTEAHVTITDDETMVRAMVTDAGVGFDLDDVDDAQARVQRVGRRAPARGRRQRAAVLRPRLGHHRRAGGARDEPSEAGHLLGPEENTLGVVVGTPVAPSESDATRASSGRRHARTARASAPAFLGLGAAIVVGLRAVYGFELVRRRSGAESTPSRSPPCRLDRARSRCSSARS